MKRQTKDKEEGASRDFSQESGEDGRRDRVSFDNVMCPYYLSSCNIKRDRARLHWVKHRAEGPKLQICFLFLPVMNILQTYTTFMNKITRQSKYGRLLPHVFQVELCFENKFTQRCVELEVFQMRSNCISHPFQMRSNFPSLTHSLKLPSRSHVIAIRKH